MNSVKGQGGSGRQAAGQIVGDERSDREGPDDWAEETPESRQLRQALIEAGRAAMPKHDPARLDRVFRRIVAQLEQEEREGIPVPRLDSPSGLFG